MKNIETRKKLFTIYYDNLTTKQQADVLKKLGINSCNSCGECAFINEAKLCSVDINEWIDVMRPYI